MDIPRVLQIFTVLNRGGAESMIMNYYREIDKTKLQFDFLVHRLEKGDFEKEINELGGKVYRLSPINPLFPAKYYNELRSFFKKHNYYKVVHSHLNTFSTFPLKIAKEFEIPCRIAHAHIAIEKINLKNILTNKESISETLKKIIKLQLKKRIHKNATHYFSCGEKAGKWLFGSETSFIKMNNAIDTQKFIVNEKKSKEYRTKFNLEDNLIIGHVGRFNSQKNHSYLLNVFQELLHKKNNCELILVGDGYFKNKLINEAKSLKIEKKVHFLGVRSDIPELFQMMDIFVFPSFYEGLPVTLIEAQAAGLQILASDTITKEVQLTQDIEFLSIKEQPAYWANKIISKTSINKSNNYDLIEKGGYDIVNNTKNKEAFYLEQISK